jgi:L-cysteine/cystine lyase
MSDAAAQRLAALRARMPVLARLAYLNAGTNGPLADVGVTAAGAELERELAGGRGDLASFAHASELRAALREHYAARLGAAAADVALTSSTTDGIGRALLGLAPQPGEEILTSDEEHPGVLGPLAAQRARGVEVRVAPFAQLADAVGPRTALVVCSHVSWRSGRVVDTTALAAAGVPVVLDGAQGVGAVSLDVAVFGAQAIYAGSGQKWLCGPNGTGMLYVAPGLRERLRPAAPGWAALAEPNAGLAATPWPDARAFDAFTLPSASLAQALATLELLDATGWEAIHTHAFALAERAADALRERGRDVLPRDRTTLVTWHEPDAPAVLERLAEAGVVVRTLPDEDLLRASFGGWSTDDDLDRLLTALSS